MNQVILLSGPPGAGKTLVGEALCERFDRMVHVEVDDLRHWVKAGYRHPWVGDRQAAEQLELAGRVQRLPGNRVALTGIMTDTDPTLPGTGG